MSAKAFLDTNIVVYALAQSDARTAVAERLLLSGGVVSVQVLNEFVAVARRKLNRSWPDVRAALTAIRQLCGDPLAVDAAIHDVAIDLAEANGLSIYDATIVAAAEAAGCDVLYSEDMQHGRAFAGGLRIENPFLAQP